MKKMIITMMLLPLFLVAFGQAAVPHVFNYQGYLSDLDGYPLDGNYNLVFRIYDAGSGSDPALWTETHTLVQVVDGVFSVLLGSLVDLPPAVLEEDALWIGVTVGSDTEISPRLQVTSTPWAYRAAIADSSVVTGAGGGEGGTVFLVNTGSGLTGGPITTSGTASVATGGITNSHLANNAVSSAKIADGTVTGTDIASNTITSSDIATGGVATSEILDNTITNSDISTSAAILASKISGDVGVDFSNIGSSSSIPTTIRNMGSVSINCPTSGYVLLCLTGFAVFFGENTACKIGIGDSATEFDYSVQMGHIDATTPLGRYEYSFSPVWVVSVSSGTKTFYALAQRPAVFSANIVNLGNVFLTAVFVPKRY